MIFIFVTCFSFILLFKYSLPIPAWASEMRLLSFYFWKDLSILFPFAKFFKNTIFPPKSKQKHNNNNLAVCLLNEGRMSMLDLPDLALELILERLEPGGLCKMACVCTYLRDMCLSDHLWESHMTKRWGRVIGHAANKKWQLHISTENAGDKVRGVLMGFLSRFWHVVLLTRHKKLKISSQPSVDSIVSFHRALETGKFWFPAQVFNRENGHVGFILSCYDADLSYDSHTDTFQARYPPHGRRAATIETGVSWDRIRGPPVDASPHELHISDCLNNLRPRDHIEIQWRRNKQFPYGWWYGVVGHLETCDGNNSYCHCHENDIVVLEFNQYTADSRWRQTMINKRNHREEGNVSDGFYGGIRKLYHKDEISMWQHFWPAEILQ